MKLLVITTLLYLFFFADARNALHGYKEHLGTRTPYRFRCNYNVTAIKYNSCQDIKIWMLIRHGTRLPSPKDIVGMNTTLKHLKKEIITNDGIKGILTKEQLRKIREWTSQINQDYSKDLTIEGEEEMILLAERMQKRFSNAIPTNYNNQSFIFRYTPTQRTQQSARYFTIGLFDKYNAQKVKFFPAQKKDTVLRFYKYCDRWRKEVKKNDSTYREQVSFGESQQMNDTLYRVSTKLGLNRNLTLDEGVLIYKICGFETSWEKFSESPWCFAIDVEDAKIFEYYFDLKHYWMDGYGYEISYKPACMAIKTMFELFSNKDGPNATFLFAHSGTLLKLLAHLQLYQPDHHLKADFVEKNRRWRVSAIDSFGSNLAFVLYRCSNIDYVLTLHQERIVKLPMCEEELCPLSFLKQYFSRLIDDCEYDEMCSLTEEKDIQTD